MLGKTPYLALFIWFFMLGSCPLQAKDQAAAQDDFQSCNAQYSKGDFAAAVICYADLQQVRGFSSGLSYNLANAYAQLGQVGPAVLNYERAHRLAPKDADIIGNLSFIRKESGLFPPEQPTFAALLARLSLEDTAILALAAMVLLTATAAAGLAAKGRRKRMIRSGLVVFSVAAVAFSAMTWRTYQDYNPSVVTGSDVRLLISPFDGAEQVGALAEGRLVTTTRKHGDYVLVVDETGRKGWLTEDSITPVVPKS